MNQRETFWDRLNYLLYILKMCGKDVVRPKSASLTRKLSAGQKLLVPINSADSSSCAGFMILLSFMTRATFPSVSNVSDMKEKVA